MKRQKEFEILIFKEFRQNEIFEKIRSRILNVRETMLNSHNSFGHFSTQRQFDYCVTITMIAISSQRQQQNESIPISRPKDIFFTYSIDRKREKIVTINLQTT